MSILGSLFNMASWVLEKHCWKGYWFPWHKLVLTSSNYQFHYQFTSDLWQVTCNIFPFLHLFLPLLCWQKCLYTFDMYIQVLFFFFPSFHCHLFLLHKHLIIWRWIWVVSNLRTCSHIFNIKVWLLLVSTFWYNVTVLHHTHQCDITKNDFFALKNGNFYWGMTGI